MSSLILAQSSPMSFYQGRQYVTQPQEVRTLPGDLNNVLVFNSNSPEVVQTEGILLSTFPADIKKFPNAHLNKPLNGRFDVFSHHIARPAERGRPLYQGIIVYNPGNQPVTIKVLQAASYLTSSDAPFIDLPPQVEDPQGAVFSGPGSRLMGDVLRGVHQPIFADRIVIPPQQSKMLFSLLIPASSARSTFMRLESTGEVYMANLAMYGIPEYSPANNLASKNSQQKLSPSSEPNEPLPPPPPTYREPALAEWRKLLLTGQLVYPRDLAPTPLDDPSVIKTIYGRVAGVSQGSEWTAKVVDPGKTYLSIPQTGQAFSYPLSTVNEGTYGTEQVQSAPMLVRYPDTAYRAHGNYAVHYYLSLPLRNTTSTAQTVTLAIQTPLKQDRYSDRLFFIPHPQGQVFFRGTVRVSYVDKRGQTQSRYFHLVQRQGQQGEPLLTLNLQPGEMREVTVDFLYPPDATPPQVLTVKTLDYFSR
ncbi:conserved hypothetical protein [Gloeothece citriformis PCC 7424]|uniref:DUF3370 domain-containing protein n=2 Tax=Gloeothece TaxID=28070 RepID=B7KJW4_GLOC7|nr:conserved hypothetical protein [Gloeothece citriformis PCC 7424]